MTLPSEAPLRTTWPLPRTAQPFGIHFSTELTRFRGARSRQRRIIVNAGPGILKLLHELDVGETTVNSYMVGDSSSQMIAAFSAYVSLRKSKRSISSQNQTNYSFETM